MTSRRKIGTLMLLLTLLGIAGVVRAALRARTPSPTPVANAGALEPARPGAGASRALAPSRPLAEIVQATVARNPFRPDRQPAHGRYSPDRESQLSAPASPAVAAPPPRPPIPQIRLTGLIAAANGKGMVALEVAGAPARLLSVGDSIAGFRLVRVTSSEAVLARADTTLILSERGPAP